MARHRFLQATHFVGKLGSCILQSVDADFGQAWESVADSHVHVKSFGEQRVIDFLMCAFNASLSYLSCFRRLMRS